MSSLHNVVYVVHPANCNSLPSTFAGHLKVHLFGSPRERVWGLFMTRFINLLIIIIIIIIITWRFHWSYVEISFRSFCQYSVTVPCDRLSQHCRGRWTFACDICIVFLRDRQTDKETEKETNWPLVVSVRRPLDHWPSWRGDLACPCAQQCARSGC